LKENDLDKIERYIKGMADDNEIKWVESQFLTGEENFTLRNMLKNDWDLMQKNSSTSEVDLNYILNRVHHILRKKEILKMQKPSQKFKRIYMKAAAVLLLPLLISGGLVYRYLGNQGKAIIDQQVVSKIYAPLGARVSFNLPDGTTGMLNSDSYLSYSLPFTSNRRVKLEGEAWFEVNRDENHPFEISTGNSTVKVLGTSFNVSAYQAENYVEVVLQKGKVEFRKGTDNENIIMLPSERLVFQDGNISKSVVDPAKYSGWTEGNLVFKADLMADVVRRIERWYNVKIELADHELEKYSFRATFQDDSLEDVLRFLSMTSPISYVITPREMLQDGTFKKEKVTIYLRK
jgi:ferric-dicitrate binding protein FerR (iron transport regulator)